MGSALDLPEKLTQYATQGRLGIIGMEERVLSVGGTIQLQSHPGRGTRIPSAISPIQRPDQALS